MGDPASELSYGLNWVCGGAMRVLHFGCGDGELLRRSATSGTQIHVGIDASPKLIAQARKITKNPDGARYYFRYGGVAEFQALLPNSFDAAIIWGAIDELSPEDGKFILSELFRVVAAKGKIMLKLGGHEGQEEIQLNEMPLLWGMTAGEWTTYLEEKFIVKPCRDIYIREQRRHEGLFLLQKPEI